MLRHYDRLQACLEESKSFPYLHAHVDEKELVLLMAPVALEQLKLRLKVFNVTESLSLPRM